MQRGFSLIEVLVSLFIISATIFSLITQQLHHSLLSNEILRQWTKFVNTTNLIEQPPPQSIKVS
ncbi:Tfp pilus assembly protein PilV [Legionella busanensis]|uniref:Tfp pilus assembly protein PilV n=1 Tax=Legionella busanensis TaxID=190655 RepID=A0A378JKU0_9GAMM|nr:prepilin-type N-terminal cleavage/methylation domain-containing protein [Legionella busanensis]STX50730.1 Tfp pilus assembly protein PilV [Legionella busanensis]